MYVPSDGPADRFVPPLGQLPRLYLIDYQGGLRLIEDETGLLVGPTDRRLAQAAIHVDNLRGEKYHAAAARAADLRPGKPVRLVPEPENPHDSNAVAVYPGSGNGPVGYVGKQKARTWSELLTHREALVAISLRATGPGRTCPAIAVLAAAPDVVAHLLAPRPASGGPPVFLR